MKLRGKEGMNVQRKKKERKKRTNEHNQKKTHTYTQHNFLLSVAKF